MISHNYGEQNNMYIFNLYLNFYTKSENDLIKGWKNSASKLK